MQSLFTSWSELQTRVQGYIDEKVRNVSQLKNEELRRKEEECRRLRERVKHLEGEMQYYRTQAQQYHQYVASQQQQSRAMPPQQLMFAGMQMHPMITASRAAGMAPPQSAAARSSRKPPPRILPITSDMRICAICSGRHSDRTPVSEGQCRSCSQKRIYHVSCAREMVTKREIEVNQSTRTLVLCHECVRFGPPKRAQPVIVKAPKPKAAVSRTSGLPPLIAVRGKPAAATGIAATNSSQQSAAATLLADRLMSGPKPTPRKKASHPLAAALQNAKNTSQAQDAVVVSSDSSEAVPKTVAAAAVASTGGSVDADTSSSVSSSNSDASVSIVAAAQMPVSALSPESESKTAEEEAHSQRRKAPKKRSLADARSTEGLPALECASNAEETDSDSEYEPTVESVLEKGESGLIETRDGGGKAFSKSKTTTTTTQKQKSATKKAKVDKLARGRPAKGPRKKKRRSMTSSVSSLKMQKWLDTDAEEYGTLIVDAEAVASGIDFKFRVGQKVLKRCPYTGALIFCEVMERQVRRYAFDGIHVAMKYYLCSSPSCGKKLRNFWDFVPEFETLECEAQDVDGNANRVAAIHWIYLSLMREYYETHEPSNEIMMASKTLINSQKKAQKQFWEEFQRVCEVQQLAAVRTTLLFQQFDTTSRKPIRLSLKVKTKCAPKTEHIMKKVKPRLLSASVRDVQVEAHQIDWCAKIAKGQNEPTPYVFQFGFCDPNNDNGDTDTRIFDVLFATTWDNVDLANGRKTTPFFGYRRMVDNRMNLRMSASEAQASVRKAATEILAVETSEAFMAALGERKGPGFQVDIRFMEVMHDKIDMQKRQHHFKKKFFDVSKWPTLEEMETIEYVFAAILFDAEMLSLYKGLVELK